jgi:hypothetical protein
MTNIQTKQMKKIKNFKEYGEIYEANIFSKGIETIKGFGKKIAGKAGEWLLALAKAEKDGTIPVRNKKYHPDTGGFDLPMDYTGEPIKATPVAKVYLPEGYGDIKTRQITLKNIGEKKVFEAEEASWKTAQKSQDEEITDVDGSTLKDDLEFAYTDPSSKSRPLLIWGAPGIGKTSIVRSFALKEKGIPVIEVILSLMEPTDVAGLPGAEPDKKYSDVKRSVNYLPMIWPLDNGPDDKGGVIFLDEVNRAHPSVQAAMLKVVLDREIASANYKVPSKWVIIAAANRPEDEPAGLIKPMSFALANRFAQVNFMLDPNTWVKWARSENISDDVVTFVELLQDYFYKLPHQLSPTGMTTQGVTPRDWEYASHEYEMRKSKAEAAGGELSDEEMAHIFKKHLGNSTGRVILDFIKTTKEWPLSMIQKVYINPTDPSLQLPKTSSGLIDRRKSWGAMYMTSKYKLGQQLDKQEFVNLLKYLIIVGDGELALATINMVKRTHPEIKSYFGDTSLAKDVTPFMQKYPKYFKE